jgi:hypothetical protein
MHLSALVGALSLILLLPTASSGPISNANQVSSLANTIFTKFDQDQTRIPSDCVKLQVPGTSQSFARCSNNDRDPYFLVTFDQMKQIWDQVKAAWGSKQTTINSRRKDYSVTLFDQIDYTPIWTIEHGKACQDQSLRNQHCIVLQFVRFESMGEYTQIGSICNLPNSGKCYPNAECVGTVSSTSIQVCDYKYSKYHESCGGGGFFDPVCEPGFKCQFPGPFQGVRGRCVRPDEPTLGGDRNGEGGSCGTRFEGCASPFYCYKGVCRAIAGPHSSCGAGTFKECVAGYQCRFGPDNPTVVPDDQRGVCFPVKGKLDDLCEVPTGCEDGLECAEKGASRVCVAKASK